MVHAARKFGSLLLFAGLLLLAAWVVRDAWLPKRPDFLRIALAVVLGLGAFGLLQTAVRSLRGRISGKQAWTACRDTLGSTALTIACLWGLWRIFLWVQMPDVQRITAPVAAVFGRRVGFWIFWLVVVPFGLALVFYLSRKIFDFLSRPFRSSGKEKEEQVEPIPKPDAERTSPR